VGGTALPTSPRGRRKVARPGPPGPPAPFRERARRFVFENQSEKDRFGIFDPFLRLMFAFGVALGAVLSAGTIFDVAAASSRSAGYAASALAAVAILAGGFLAYHAIWRPPSEREILLQMAKEDDEARRLRARLESRAGDSKRG
jgi:hypothetical protein